MRLNSNRGREKAKEEAKKQEERRANLVKSRGITEKTKKNETKK